MSIIHGIGIIRFACTSIMLSMSLPISSRDSGHRLRLNSYGIQERIALFKVVNPGKELIAIKHTMPRLRPWLMSRLLSCPGCSHAPASPKAPNNPVQNPPGSAVNTGPGQAVLQPLPSRTNSPSSWSVPFSSMNPFWMQSSHQATVTSTNIALGFPQRPPP